MRDEPIGNCWHLITCEYPPQPGGVSDYTERIADRLAEEGDEVHVWCPRWTGTESATRGVNVHRDLGGFSATDLHQAGTSLDRYPGPRRLLVQWVPHGYGYRSMNVAFCHWLRRRALVQGDQIDLMVHEPFLAFGEGSWRQNAAALVHRLMIVTLLRAAKRVWVSIPAWEPLLRPYALRRNIPFEWLPVPSNIPVVEDSRGAAQIRSRYRAEHRPLIGHFGTYGLRICSLLEPVLEALSRDKAAQSIVFMGRGSSEFRQQLIARRRALESCTWAAGELPPVELSRHISACDMLIQPYPDGVSARRGSAMVGLSHGKAILTTVGRLSEPLWNTSRAVQAVPCGDSKELIAEARRLRDDGRERDRLGRNAKAFYQDHFDVRHVVAKLRATNIPLLRDLEACAS